MYKLNPNSTCITRSIDGASIPADPDNSDYANYLQWLADGNTPGPADPVVVPPIKIVTMRQARLALLGAGLLSTVNAAVAGMAGAQGEAARIEWEYSQEVQRDRGLVAALGSTLGLTDPQLDALFVAAHAIP